MVSDYPERAPIYLAGPTGCGKTGVALEIARLSHAPIEVVNADAYQIYAGLEILSAAPTPEERVECPHHLFGTIPLSEELDASRYAEMARSILAEIVARGATPLVIGGSGLYLKSLTHGLADVPKGDPDLRAELDELGFEELVARYLKADPAGAAETNLKNRRYVTRNLEITLLAGQPASELKATFAGQRPDIRAVTLVRERAELYERINQRTFDMFDDGVVEEVERVLVSGALSTTAERAIGLREISDLIAGTLTREEAISTIQQSTRRYAKRQLNWFRREGFPQVAPSAEAVLQVIGEV